MKTYSVAADKRFSSCLGYVRSRFPDSAQVGNRVSVTATEAELKDCLTEIIVTDCKAHYITEKLRVRIADPVRHHAFIRALSTFDYETDKILAGAMLELTETFLFSSFYDFCIADLKRRWDEVCVLANENVALLLNQHNLDELLRFLIQNIESSTSVAYLRIKENEVLLLNRNMEEFKDIYVNSSLPNELSVIEKLVALSPHRIIFMGEWCDFFDSVANLFSHSTVIDQAIKLC